MPRLQSITCNVELDPGNTKLKEYQQRFRDGAVECFVAVPEMPIPFSVHMHTHGWISSGIAMFVYIDGEYHANRNKACPAAPAPDSKPQDFDIDLRIRQKEEKLHDGSFIGRPWTFTELKLAEADVAPTFNSDRQREIGTIEVVVLRCNYEVLEGVPRSARANSAAVRSVKAASVKAPSVKAPSVKVPSVKAPSSVKAATIAGSDAGFGGMFGLFDGAGEMEIDEPVTFGLDGVGDERPYGPPDVDAPYWSEKYGEYTHGGQSKAQLETDSVFGGVREVDGESAIIDTRSAIQQEWGQDRIKTLDNTPEAPKTVPGTHGFDGHGYASQFRGPNEYYPRQQPSPTRQPQGYPQHLRQAPYQQRQVPHQSQENRYGIGNHPHGGQAHSAQIPREAQGPWYDNRDNQRTQSQEGPRHQQMNNGQYGGHHGRPEYEDTIARINRKHEYYAQQQTDQRPQQHEQNPPAYGGPQHVQNPAHINATYHEGPHAYQQQPQTVQQPYQQQPNQQQFQQHQQPALAGDYPRVVPDSLPGVPDFIQERDQKVSQYVYDPEYQQYWIWKMDPRMLSRYGVDQGLFAAATPYLRVLMHIEVRDLRTHQLPHIRGMLEYYKKIGIFPDGKKVVPMRDPNSTPGQASREIDTSAQKLGEWLPKSGEKPKHVAPANEWSGNATAEKSSGKSSATHEHFTGGDQDNRSGWGNIPGNKSSGQDHANSWGNTPANKSDGQGKSGGWDNTPANNSGNGWGESNQNLASGGGDGGGWGDQKDSGGSGEAAWGGGQQNGGDQAGEAWGGGQDNKNYNNSGGGGGWGGEQNNNQNKNEASWGNTDGNAAAPGGGWGDNTQSNNQVEPAPSVRSGRTGDSHDPRAHIKPYWGDWRKPSGGHGADPNTRRRDTAREVFHYPAPPCPTISNDQKDVDASHGVQVGKGANYSHQRRRPVYLDTMAEPYCVFTFKYRSKQRLEQILNRNIDSDCDKIENEVQKGNLLALSKEELVQQLMQQNRSPTGGNAAPAAGGGQGASGGSNAWGHDGQVNNAAPANDGWGASAANNNDAGGAWGETPAENKNEGGDSGWAGGDKNDGGEQGQNAWASNHGGKSQAGKSNATRQDSHHSQKPASHKSAAGGGWGQQEDSGNAWGDTAAAGNTDWAQTGAGVTGGNWDGTADIHKPFTHHHTTPTPHSKAQASSRVSSRMAELLKQPEAKQVPPTFTPLSADDVFKVGGQTPAPGDVYAAAPPPMRWADPETQAFDASVQPAATGFKRPVTHLW